jgi:predicted ester cyclase
MTSRKDTMDSSNRLRLVSRFFDEVWNDGDFSFIDENYAPDFTLHALWQNTALGGSGEAAKETAKTVIGAWRDALPDLFMTVEEAFVDGDMVIMRHRCGGTQEGELMGIAPTGLFGEITGVTMTRVADDGLITDAWTCWDALYMLQQLGVVPGPPLFPNGAEKFAVAEHAGAADTRVVERLYEELFNGTGAADELIAADCITHAPGPPLLHGPDGMDAFINVWRTAFPDGVMTLDAVHCEGDRVATRFRFEGTHTGPLVVIEPSGQRATVGGMAISRVVDGKIVSHWCEIDRAAVMQQIGLAGPAPVGAAR